MVEAMVSAPLVAISNAVVALVAWGEGASLWKVVVDACHAGTCNSKSRCDSRWF